MRKRNLIGIRIDTLIEDDTVISESKETNQTCSQPTYQNSSYQIRPNLRRQYKCSDKSCSSNSKQPEPEQSLFVNLSLPNQIKQRYTTFCSDNSDDSNKKTLKCHKLQTDQAAIISNKTDFQQDIQLQYDKRTILRYSLLSVPAKDQLVKNNGNRNKLLAGQSTIQQKPNGLKNLLDLPTDINLSEIFKDDNSRINYSLRKSGPQTTQLSPQGAKSFFQKENTKANGIDFTRNGTNQTRNKPRTKTSNLSVHFKDFICISQESQHSSLRPKLQSPKIPGGVEQLNLVRQKAKKIFNKKSINQKISLNPQSCLFQTNNLAFQNNLKVYSPFNTFGNDIRLYEGGKINFKTEQNPEPGDEYAQSMFDRKNVKTHLVKKSINSGQILSQAFMKINICQQQPPNHEFESKTEEWFKKLSDISLSINNLSIDDISVTKGEIDNQTSFLTPLQVNSQILDNMFIKQATNCKTEECKIDDQSPNLNDKDLTISSVLQSESNSDQFLKKFNIEPLKIDHQPDQVFQNTQLTHQDSKKKINILQKFSQKFESNLLQQQKIV